jgi:hypothetical protein
MTLLTPLVGFALAALAARTPDFAVGMVMTPIVVSAIVALTVAVARRHPDPFLAPTLRAGCVMRLAMVGAHLFIGFVVYGGAMDFVGWWGLAFQVWAIVTDPEKLDLFLTADQWSDDYFQFRSQLTTPALILLTMGFVGPNIVAVFVVGAALSAVTAYWFYLSFEAVAPDVEGRRLYAKLIFLFPSFAFWSVLLGKDVWTLFFMGLATLCVARATERPRVLPLVGFGLALFMVTLLRPHIGAVLALGAMCAFAFRPLPLSGPTLYLRPLLRMAILGGAALVLLQIGRTTIGSVGVTALTLEALSERAYLTHEGFASEGTGAALPVALASGSPTDLLKFLPFGMFTLLFRPFVWEAHNVVALMTALENVVFTALVVWRLGSFRHGFRLARTRPFLIFAAVAMLAGTAVLCVEWNLGALVRHRAMVLPFLFMFLALPRTRAAPKDASST